MRYYAAGKNTKILIVKIYLIIQHTGMLWTQFLQSSTPTTNILKFHHCTQSQDRFPLPSCAPLHLSLYIVANSLEIVQI